MRVVLFCQKFFLRSNFFHWGALSTFIHLSLCKAGPFALENHIHVKAFKTQGFPNNWMLYESLYSKNSTQTNFQGGTPWVTEILNNVIVWMVPYFAQKPGAGSKNTKLVEGGPEAETSVTLDRRKAEMDRGQRPQKTLEERRSENFKHQKKADFRCAKRSSSRETLCYSNHLWHLEGRKVGIAQAACADPFWPDVRWERTRSCGAKHIFT